MKCGITVKAAVAICLVWPLGTSAATPREYQIAAENLTVIFEAKYGQSLDDRFKNSGVDPTDKARITVDLLTGYARCVVDELLKNQDPRASRLFSMLLAGLSQARAALSELEVPSNPNDEAWARTTMATVESCMLTVEQEVGFAAGR